MFKNNITIEEEKVNIPEKIISSENLMNNSNDNLNNNEKQNNSNNINIISSIDKPIYNYIDNSSNINLKNEDLNKETINSHSNELLNQQIINDDNNINIFKTINNINKTENKNKKNEKNLKVVTVNKDDLYNAFVLFQQLISRYENENNIEYIKNKLFEFISYKKVNCFSETIECNGNYDDNDNIFDIQNYMPIYCKSDRDLNLNNEKNKNINLLKSYSFSFNINDKNRILNNYLYTFINDQKDTIKSNSQIFNEYLLIDRKIKDKTISQENSKSFHHNYSFDLKNREKNELSFHSIPEQDKEKEKEKYYVIDNDEIINKFSYDNFNSYEKEMEHKSPFDNKGFRLFANNIRKYSTEEDLLIEPLNKKNKNMNLLEYNENQIIENKNNKNILNKNNSIKEKILISPTKQEENKTENIIKENNKNNLDSQQQNNILHEIKVNKNKSLNNKEQIINEKIKELNEEIKKFKEETKKVNLLKEEYEKLQEKLDKDIKEFNLKKRISQKNYKGNGQSEVKLIMSITQHNQALILNNKKKKETIKLLKERIYELENIIKAKNNYEHNNQKNIFKKINNYNSERLNIFTKKRNIKKKNNDSYMLKRARINLKKKVESNSSEKIKRNKNSEIINQTMNNNSNNINKIYFECKNITNKNKKLMNVSYNQSNIKNSIFNSKLPNYNIPNNNCFKKFRFNAYSNKNFTKKNHLSNQTNIAGNNNRNNSINVKKLKIENPVIHTNLYIYEKLINKEREKEKNYKKININMNSERDLGNKKLFKELKTEIQEKNKNEKEKERKTNNIKKYQKSQGKNLIINRLDIKTDIFKNKSNLNILSSYKTKHKTNSINKKNITSIRQLTSNFTKKLKSRENTKNNIKEINNSLDNKDIKKDINISINNNEIDYDDENDINGYDFIIPEIYKKNNKAEIINSVEQDGKKINIYDNHKKEIIFKSGVRKEIFMDGYQLVHFPNGDLKQKFVGKEEKVIYYYNETSTVQTTYKNGLNIFKFSNGQIEKHYPDGSKFIIYTNGIKRKIYKNGREEVFVPNEGQQELNKEENNIKNINKENENNNYSKENENIIFIKKNITSRKDDDKESNLLLSFLDIDKN